MLATAGVKGFAFTLGDRHARVAVHRGAGHLGDPRRDGAHARSSGSRFALGARRERARWKFDFIGQVEVVLLDVGRDPRGRRARDRRHRHQVRHRLRVGHPDQDAGRAAGRASTTCATRSRRSASGTRRSRRSTSPSSARTCSRSPRPTLEPGEVSEVREALDEEFGVDRADFSSSSIGPTFGAQIARTALIADHRLADPDLDLHRRSGSSSSSRCRC